MAKAGANTSRVREFIRQSLFPENLRHRLEAIVPEKGERLYKRYIELINDSRLGLLDKLGVDAGKFVEEFVEIVAGIEGVPIKPPIKSKVKATINAISSALKQKVEENESREKQIMLEVAYYSIYMLRNSRDAAHAKPTPISQWDARHIVETATWLLEEFLRIYGGLSRDVVENIFYPFSLPISILRVVEIIDGKLVPLVDKLESKDLVLLALISSESDCLAPKDIIKIIPEAKSGTIYPKLRELAKGNYIVKVGGRKGCYKITSKGRNFIYERIKSITS
ncbi:MAG: hypothetical protein LRS47_01305 [Desulfurococcales archaeon]|nr:hypothetical protein [Desulfurococcales archaeon]